MCVSKFRSKKGGGGGGGGAHTTFVDIPLNPPLQYSYFIVYRYEVFI